MVKFIENFFVDHQKSIDLDKHSELDVYVRNNFIEKRDVSTSKKCIFSTLTKISQPYFYKFIFTNRISPSDSMKGYYDSAFGYTKTYMTKRQSSVLSFVFGWNNIHLISSISNYYKATESDIYSINPVTTFDLSAYNESNEQICSVASDLVLDGDNEENKLKIKMLNNDKDSYNYPESILPIMSAVKDPYTEKETIVINPLEMYGYPGFLYGSRPAFLKSSISEYSLIHQIVSSVLNITPKNRLSNFEKIIFGDYTRNRQAFIADFNGFARCLLNLYYRQRDLLFKSSKVIHCDETRVLCLESDKSMNYVWVLASTAHIPFKQIFFWPSETRKTEEFLKQFQNGKFNDNIEAITSDLYDVYLSDDVKSILKNVNISACHQHLRKRILDDLEKMGLRDVFLSVSNLGYDKFIPALGEKLDEIKLKPGPIGSKLIVAAYFQELIFRHEKDFAFTSGQEMYDRRQKYTLDLLNIFYEILEDIAAGLDISYKEIDGKKQFKGTGCNPCENSLLYALNHKAEFYQFIYNGDIDLTNNFSERLLRRIALYRCNSEFFSTKDGHQSYLIYCTLVSICKENGINPEKYFGSVAKL